MVFHKLQSSQLEKNSSKNHSLCSIWCRSVNPILCKESFRTSETCSATNYVYFRSCITRQWLWFWGFFSSHDELEQSSATFLLRGRWTCRQTRRWLFNLKNRCPETPSHTEQRQSWQLSILIHYTFPNTLSISVFHLQSVSELSMWFQTGYWFNWMDNWYLILMSCAKH